MDNRHDRVENSTQPSAAELQRRLQDTRTSITNTVEEMKTTMNTQYNQAKDRATQSLDWKLQMRKYPVAACLGALAVGFLAGRSLADASEDHDFPRRGIGPHEPDFTSMHGSSQVPAARSHGISERLVSPQTRARMASRVEDVLGNLTEQFMGELTRVGREVVVPTLIGALSSKLSNMGSSSASHIDSGQQNVGGTGAFGSQPNRGSSYQGRAL